MGTSHRATSNLSVQAIESAFRDTTMDAGVHQKATRTIGKLMGLSGTDAALQAIHDWPGADRPTSALRAYVPKGQKMARGREMKNTQIDLAIWDRRTHRDIEVISAEDGFAYTGHGRRLISAFLARI